MNDLEQWAIYGMFACLLAECDEERSLAERMATEADGEGMLEEFETGDDEMYAWLCRYRQLPPSRRFNPTSHYGGWPLTLH